MILIAALQKSAGMKPGIERVSYEFANIFQLFFFFNRVSSKSIDHVGGRLQGTAGHYVKL